MFSRWRHTSLVTQVSLFLKNRPASIFFFKTSWNGSRTRLFGTRQISQPPRQQQLAQANLLISRKGPIEQNQDSIMVLSVISNSPTTLSCHNYVPMSRQGMHLIGSNRHKVVKKERKSGKEYEKELSENLLLKNFNLQVWIENYKKIKLMLVCCTLQFKFFSKLPRPGTKLGSFGAYNVQLSLHGFFSPLWYSQVLTQRNWLLNLSPSNLNDLWMWVFKYFWVQHFWHSRIVFLSTSAILVRNTPIRFFYTKSEFLLKIISRDQESLNSSRMFNILSFIKIQAT